MEKREHCSLEHELGYDPCIKVTQVRKLIKLRIHRHPLILMPKKASFKCDACGETGEDLSYFCDICPLWLHKTCASLPINIIWQPHPHHTLFLGYHRLIKYPRTEKCHFCNETIHMPAWAYSCNTCRYIVHIKCVKQKFEQMVDASKAKNLIQLPWKETATDLIKPFLEKKEIIIQTSTEEINHFSHGHPLTLSYIPIDELQNGEETLCDGCVEPILTNPYYNCTSCGYFLHTSCAHLPEKLQHFSPVNQKKVFLRKQLKNPAEWFICGHCGGEGNGFFFGSHDLTQYFHLHCAILPTTVTHETHKEHPITVRVIEDPFHKNIFLRCKACGEIIRSQNNTDKMYLCTARCSNFGLHLQCAMLPRTVRHRWDRHELVLNYNSSFSTDPSKKFDCEVCDEQIEAHIWRYYCRECDQSFHPFCIPRLAKDGHIKYGGSVRVKQHEHLLKFVREGKYDSPCSNTINQAICDKQDLYGKRAFECESCEFSMCDDCVYNSIEREQHS